jgi:hypothetical protein
LICADDLLTLESGAEDVVVCANPNEAVAKTRAQAKRNLTAGRDLSALITFNSISEKEAACAAVSQVVANTEPAGDGPRSRGVAGEKDSSENIRAFRKSHEPELMARSLPNQKITPDCQTRILTNNQGKSSKSDA